MIKIADNPERPPDPVVHGPKTASSRIRQHRLQSEPENQVSRARVGGGRGQGFTRLPVTAFLKGQDGEISGQRERRRQRGFGEENYGGFQVRKTIDTEFGGIVIV